MDILKVKNQNGVWVAVPAMEGPKGDPGEGVASGGTTGQVLKKSSNTDYDTEWADEAVQDVQINGTSILTDGVANIPSAASSVMGVIKLGDGFSTDNSTQKTNIDFASATNIKDGASQKKPINPYAQHRSVFYGLAKAAGDTSQSASDNAVGTYTNDALVKIQKMLGIYQPPWELLNDFTLDEEGRFALTADSDGVPYNLLTAYVIIYYPANTLTASTGYDRYRFLDENNKLLNAETGKYSAQTNVTSKYVFVHRVGKAAFCDYSTRQPTGGAMVHNRKWANGFEPNYGNIVKIELNSADVEPAGTQIKIYGQRAY